MTVGHDDVVAEDAFGVCAELGDRGFGVLVAVVRRKHHADRAELFECMPEHEQLHRWVDLGATRRGGDPG